MFYNGLGYTVIPDENGKWWFKIHRPLRASATEQLQPISKRGPYDGESEAERACKAEIDRERSETHLKET